ncbi:MAG: DUF3576 domain-containing protein [Rhodospirillaceae bacterium]|jgi:hypothetical protein|nr:DUF3576 domain-containing protein [Rhodospirillaceae bacterium]
MTSTPRRGRIWHRTGICMAAALLLGACGLADTEQNYPTRSGRSADSSPTGEKDSVFGSGGLNIFGGKKSDKAEGGGGIGINSFLWRASLDTLSFMPLNSADPFGGVIITDWYSPPDNPGERFKMTIYIVDRRLRADGIKVAVFRQAKNDAQEWLSAEIADDTAVQLENAILVRARQLRLDTLEQ